MAAPPVVRPMTAEEFFALPEDGKERALVHGELKEWDKTMTTRNPGHTLTESRAAYLLWTWVEQQAEPRGQVHSGEVAVRLSRDPDTVQGIDLVYISAELARLTPPGSRVIDGVPILALEVLSPSNTHEGITEKVQEFLAARIPLTWVADPVFRTVTVYRPDAEPELFNSHQVLVGDPYLPGLRIPVAALFGR